MRKRILYIGNNLTNASFTATYISFFSEVLKEEGYEVGTASDKDNKILRMEDMLSLIWKNRHNTDVVLIDTYGAQNFYYALSTGKLCQKLNLPYIPILHGGNLPGRLASSKSLCRSLFGKSYLNIAPSEFLYDIFKKEGFKNTRIIPNSIILKKYQFKRRETFAPKLLWVRRFQERYNPMMAVKVLEALNQKYPDAHMCMVGPEKDGTMEKSRNYAEKNNLSIDFAGKVTKDQWAASSVNYDFFINTTTVDNTPISVIEAMALGLPVISTDVGGMPFLIEDNKDGILLPENDIDAMVSSITNLIDNPSTAMEMAQKARNKVEAFDWVKVKEQWRAVFSSLP